jgi:hypothetical protein
MIDRSFPVAGVGRGDRMWWAYGLLFLAAVLVLADRLSPPVYVHTTVEEVRGVEVNESSRRRRAVTPWSIVNTADGSRFEVPGSVGLWTLGEPLELERSRLFKEVVRYRRDRPGTFWSRTVRESDTVETTVVVMLVALLAGALLLPWWGPQARMALRLVLVVLVVTWGMYALGAHGLRLLS